MDMKYLSVDDLVYSSNPLSIFLFQKTEKCILSLLSYITYVKDQKVNFQDSTSRI
jgi:hypothetical protein